MTKKQIDMMKHAWGFDTKSPGFRNHYCTDLKCPDMLALVDLGMMFGPHHVGLVGDDCGMFFLTNKGQNYLEQLKLNDHS